MKRNIIKHALIAWLLFSVLFWIAAYVKPFHVDEFYSWVYAQRCSFGEIFRLKDTGIGHPPLYHLVQKLVQTVLPSYHPLYVRLANYLFGSVFVFLLARFLLAHKYVPFFCYGVGVSAVVLEGFVFSRMWGLVGLSALLLLWWGEIYWERKEIKLFLVLAAICLLGFISDYNFFLTVPYIFLILFTSKTSSGRVWKILLSVLGVLWLLTAFLYNLKYADIPMFFFSIFRDITRINYTMGKMFLGFGFIELVLAALLVTAVILIAFLVKERKIPEMPGFSTAAVYLVLTVILGAFLEILMIGRILWSGAAVFLWVFVLFLVWKKQWRFMFEMDAVQTRLAAAVLGGVIILLGVNYVFWRELKQAKFIFVLFPFILFFLYRVLDKKRLHFISVLLMVTGIFYITSFRISDFFPPPDLEGKEPVVFKDEFAYSTRYLRSRDQAAEKPVFIHFNMFEKYCRVCKLGTPIDAFRFEGQDRVWMVGDRVFRFGKYIPKEFELVKTYAYLSWADRVKFKFLHPIDDNWRFIVWEFRRKE